MPYHTNPGHDKGTKPSKSVKKKMSDSDKYKEHTKKHSAKHIKAMKELQKKFGANFEEAHTFIKKYVGK
tara:strand:+ start:2936 stop:3142 length:207 start_codon:yes stop_codon:yes gene_type:complete